MNHYFNRIGSWTGDGPEGGTMTTTKSEDDATSTKVQFSSASRGTPYSVYYRLDDEDAEPATHPTCYFEAQVTSLEGHLAVGLVQPQEVLPGWRTKGMFYNGNLTNGSAALQTYFGEAVKQGHTVGIYCVAQPEGTQVYVYMNGQCLGMAFSLPPPNNGVQRCLRVPCLHVSGKATVQVAMPDRLPTILTRSFRSEGDLSGEWALLNLKIGPEVGEYQFNPEKAFITTMATLDKRSFRWNIKIQNSLSTKLSVSSSGSSSRNGNGNSANGNSANGNAGRVSSSTPETTTNIHVGTVRSGKMKVKSPLELVLSEHLPKLHELHRKPGNIMLMKGSTIELSLKRHIKVFDPLKKY